MPAHMSSFVAGLLMVVLCAYRLLCLCLAVRPHFCQFLRKPRRKDLGRLTHHNIKSLTYCMFYWILYVTFKVGMTRALHFRTRE